jgi:hypothetical protein
MDIKAKAAWLKCVKKAVLRGIKTNKYNKKRD